MSALDKWKEVGETAHMLVSSMTSNHACDECLCPIPETKENPHDPDCKVGRVVHALAGVGIDPETRRPGDPVKVTVLSIHTFVPAFSITMREWEALSRLAITLVTIFEYELKYTTFPGQEETPYHRWASVLFDPNDVGKPFTQSVFDELRKAGLQPMEWVVWLAPVLPDKALPDQPEEYTVALRLRGEKSDAKRNAMGDDLSHKPTLAEQHEKI